MFETETDMLFHVIGEKNEFDIDPKSSGKCVFCGVHDGRINKKHVFSEGFTNWDRAKNLSGTHVCISCSNVLTHRPLRISSWVCDKDGIKFMKREGIAEQLFAPHKPPFIFYVTTSFKKIGQCKVRFSYDPENFYVQFEETQVEVDLKKIAPLWEILKKFYSIPKDEETKAQPKSFFTKEEIETGEYMPYRIVEYGLDEWKEKEIIVQEYRHSGILALLLYILNRENLGFEKKVVKEEKKGKTDGKKREPKQQKQPARKSVQSDLFSMEVD